MDMSIISIPLTKGKSAIIDQQDADLATYKWHFCSGYATRKSYVNGRDRPIQLRIHSIILSRKIGRKLKANEECDHKNQDKLDNRRSNLRIAHRGQQIQNARFAKVSASGFRGVYFHAKSGLFRAEVHVNKKKMSLGYFKNAHSAALARDDAARIYYGEFGIYNFPNDGERGIEEAKAVLA